MVNTDPGDDLMADLFPEDDPPAPEPPLAGRIEDGRQPELFDWR